MKTLLLTLFFTISNAQAAAICGEDERVPSQNPRIGRIRFPGVKGAVCTATMVGKSCAISAGHCIKHMSQLEFDVPLSRGGDPQTPARSEIYPIIQRSIRGFHVKQRGDWAVFQVEKNSVTGLLPGEISGYYSVNFDQPALGEEISITGFGIDNRGDLSRSLTQQTHQGIIEGFRTNSKGPAIVHRVDTAGGNSGSSLIRVREQDIVGVHVAGSCWGELGENFATLISGHPEFQQAISECLAND